MAIDEVADFIAEPPAHPSDRAADGRRLPQTETDAWIDGSIAGVAGAVVVALFFLAIDLAQGAPLRTPSVLGSAVFLGRSLPPGTAFSFAPALGYTVMHGVLFVAAGVIAAYALIGRARELGPLTGLGLAAALFVGLEFFFLSTLSLAAPSLIVEFGVGQVATANLLAAGAMAIGLLRRHHPVGPNFARRVATGMAISLVLAVASLVFYCSSAYVALE